jgi:hypothetical protein
MREIGWENFHTREMEHQQHLSTSEREGEEKEECGVKWKGETALYRIGRGCEKVHVNGVYGVMRKVKRKTVDEEMKKWKRRGIGRGRRRARFVYFLTNLLFKKHIY